MQDIRNETRARLSKCAHFRRVQAPIEGTEVMKEDLGYIRTWSRLVPVTMVDDPKRLEDENSKREEWFPISG